MKRTTMTLDNGLYKKITLEEQEKINNCIDNLNKKIKVSALKNCIKEIESIENAKKFICGVSIQKVKKYN